MEKINISQTQPLTTQKIDQRVFFKLIEKAGSTGRYQVLTTVLWCIVSYLSGGLMFISPFLFYLDPYDCSLQTIDISCYDYVCSFSPQARLKYIPHQKLMTSIANQYGDYRCDNEAIELNFYITLMFLGCFFGLICLTIFGDIFGRKFLMTSSIALCFIGLFIAIFSFNLQMAIIGMFIAYFGCFNGFNICFYFIAQIVSEQYRQKISIGIQLFYGVGATSNVLFFYFIADYKLILLLFYAAPSIIIFGIVCFLVKDTPICLIKRKISKEILKDFAFIAKFNKKENFTLTIQEIQQIKSLYLNTNKQSNSNHNKTFTIIDLFRYKSLRMMTIVLILMSAIINIQYFSPTLLIDNFNFDIFINALVIQSGQIVAYILAYFILVRYKRRNTAIFLLSICLISSAILIFIWDQKGENENSSLNEDIIVLAMVFLLQCTITIQFTQFYVYFNELFPTQVRILGTGLVSSTGGLVFSLAPAFVQFCIEQNISIMIFFTVFAGISIVFSAWLPQTFKQTPQDIVEQLRSIKSTQFSNSLLKSP